MAHLKWHEIWNDEEKTFLRKFIERHQIPTLDQKDIARIREAAADQDLRERQSKYQADNSIWYKLYLFFCVSSSWLAYVFFILMMFLATFLASRIKSPVLLILGVAIACLPIWWFEHKKTKYPKVAFWSKWTRREYEGETLINDHPFPEFKFSILPYEVNTRESLARPLLKLELESFPASNFEFLVLSSTDGNGGEYYVGYREKVVSAAPVNGSAELLESL